MTRHVHLESIGNRLDRFDVLKDELLGRYHLLDKRNDLVATLSKGMKQKLSVACGVRVGAGSELSGAAVVRPGVGGCIVGRLIGFSGSVYRTVRDIDFRQGIVA